MSDLTERRLRKALAEAVYEITHLAAREPLWDNGPEGYKPFIKASQVDAWRRILSTPKAPT